MRSTVDDTASDSHIYFFHFLVVSDFFRASLRNNAAHMQHGDILNDTKRGFDITVIIIEHDIETAFGIVQNVTVLHMGSVIAQGSPEEIRNNEKVKKIYMGV